jgi:hypothetical protein
MRKTVIAATLTAVAIGGGGTVIAGLARRYQLDADYRFRTGPLAECI